MCNDFESWLKQHEMKPSSTTAEQLAEYGKLAEQWKGKGPNELICHIRDDFAKRILLRIDETDFFIDCIRNIVNACRHEHLISFASKWEKNYNGASFFFDLINIIDKKYISKCFSLHDLLFAMDNLRITVNAWNTLDDILKQSELWVYQDDVALSHIDWIRMIVWFLTPEQEVLSKHNFYWNLNNDSEDKIKFYMKQCTYCWRNVCMDGARKRAVCHLHKGVDEKFRKRHNRMKQKLGQDGTPLLDYYFSVIMSRLRGKGWGNIQTDKEFSSYHIAYEQNKAFLSSPWKNRHLFKPAKIVACLPEVAKMFPSTEITFLQLMEKVESLSISEEDQKYKDFRRKYTEHMTEFFYKYYETLAWTEAWKLLELEYTPGRPPKLK